MQGTKLFRDRYAKFLRKQLHQPHTMQHYLDDWFRKYKTTASEGSRPERGRLDPCHQHPLFTSETKQAVENCKEKAEYLSDPLPLHEMYDSIPPNPNSSHGLTEFLSKRGESKLEAFHDRTTHFGNSGMQATLSDSLNLCGTARHNLTIRHKHRLIAGSSPQQDDAAKAEQRKKIPAAWEKIPRIGTIQSLLGLIYWQVELVQQRSHFHMLKRYKNTQGKDSFLSILRSANLE